MRLIQLAVGANGILDLHPNVSIVTGLEDHHRALLLDAVVGLARGEAVPSVGLLEAHGVLFDLDQTLLSVIGQGSDELDPVVRPSHLPTQPATAEARALRAREHDLALLRELCDGEEQAQRQAHEVLAAATEELDGARRSLEQGTALASRSRDDLEQMREHCAATEADRPRLVAELDEAAALLNEVQTVIAATVQEVAATRVGVEEMGALRASVEAELREVEGLASADVEAEVERARAALQRVEAEVDAERAAEADRAALATTSDGSSTADTSEPAVERLEQLDARIAELERLLSVITPVERVTIERARARLAGRGASGMVASPEAARLADEIDRVANEIDALGPDASGVSGDDLSRARARLDEAHQSLLEAERAARTPALDQVVVERLEEVHEQLIEATDVPRPRFGAGKRPTTTIEELRAEEEGLLDQLGFASYPAYVMGYSLREVDPQLKEAVEAARAELAAAESEWAERERLTELALRRASLLDERRVLLEEARRLLGRVTGEGTPQEALRALRIPGEVAAAAATAVCRALEAVGIVMGDEEVDHEELLELADAWLSESDQVDTRRLEALGELGGLQARRPELAAEADAEIATAGPAQLVATQPQTDLAEQHRLERVGRARGGLAAAEQRLADAAATAERRESLVVDLAEARELEQGALDSLATAEASLSDAESQRHQLIERVAAMQDELARVDREVAEMRASIDALAGEMPDPEALQDRLVRAEVAHASALADAEEARLSVEGAQRQIAEASNEVAELRAVVGSTAASEATPAEELEWYLLARLAAQRSVSVAGSVPVILDDALRGLPAEDVSPILDRLERMAEVVQVIVLSEDPVVTAWATSVGIERAAVVGVTAA